MSNDNIIDVDFGSVPVRRSRTWLKVTQGPTPMLWVIPPDLINGAYAETLVSCISRLGNIHVWQLDGGAVAFSLPDILVKGDRPLDYEAYLKRTRPLFQIVDSCTISNGDALNLEIPDAKYSVRVSLKREETNKQSCVYFKSYVTEWSPFAFRACSSYELSQTDLKVVKDYLTDWLATASKRSVCGESLQVGNTELKDYVMLEERESIRTTVLRFAAPIILHAPGPGLTSISGCAANCRLKVVFQLIFSIRKIILRMTMRMRMRMIPRYPLILVPSSSPSAASTGFP